MDARDLATPRAPKADPNRAVIVQRADDMAKLPVKGVLEAMQPGAHRAAGEVT
jgi:hypothetical protein